MPRKPSHSYEVSPYEVIVDTREQAPYTFQGFKTAKGKKNLAVRTVAEALPAGDYSLVGYTDVAAVERKSLPDFFSTFINDRERGIAQLEKLSDNVEFPNVVVECSYEQMLLGPERNDPNDAKRVGKSMFHSITAWRYRYPSVHFHFPGNRAMAELLTLRILERLWRELNEKR